MEIFILSAPSCAWESRAAAFAGLAKNSHTASFLLMAKQPTGDKPFCTLIFIGQPWPILISLIKACDIYFHVPELD